jgi:vacuolar iron transporter family protein
MRIKTGCIAAGKLGPFIEGEPLPRTTHPERHRHERMGWLRAAVLGANDGIVSTASLVVGVAAAGAGPGSLLTTGVAGLVAGAMSMAAGEYVSVHSQSDTEEADLARERAEHQADPAAELLELQNIYIARGLQPDLAHQVAAQLTAHDALGTHVRDELGVSAALRARPVQAAFSSAASFAVGAALPLLVTAVLTTAAQAPLKATALIAGVGVSSLFFLAALGAVSARAGGAHVWMGAWRVTFWGALAMVVTAAAGSLFGAVG